MIIHDVKQNTDEWMIIRCGIPTASCASKLVTSTGGLSKSLPEYAKTLAGDKWAGKPLDTWEGNRHTERGHELEPLAADAYAFEYDCNPQVVGFVTDDLGRMGCSPDRFLGDDGILETKNLSAKKHIEALDYYDRHGKAQPTYIPQCKMLMLVTDKSYCDLQYHHPDLPHLVIRQLPDEAFFTTLTLQITAVLAERDRLLKMMEKYL